MNKNTYAIIALFLCGITPILAQVGIGTTNPKSTLDIPASNAAAPSSTDGILIPRINAFSASNPGANQDGMLVFLSAAISGYPKGFYYWDNTLTDWISYNDEWKDGNIPQSRSGFDDDLIYANQASVNGVDVVILDSGQMGMGSTDLEESLEIKLPGDNDIQLTSASPPDAPQLVYYTTNGSFASPAFLNSGEDIGYVTGKVWTGTTKSSDVANIELMTDGNHSAGSYPTKIQFDVTASGSSGLGSVNEMVIKSTGNVGIGIQNPTAVLNLKAGTASANTAPLKLTSGTNLSTPETGAIEYDGTNLYFTPSTTRKTVMNGFRNTATLNFGSIANNGSQELTVSVIGASVGSSCACSPSGSIEAGLQWTCYVSSAGVVTIRLSNVQATAINPASKSWKVSVIE